MRMFEATGMGRSSSPTTASISRTSSYRGPRRSRTRRPASSRIGEVLPRPRGRARRDCGCWAHSDPPGPHLPATNARAGRAPGGSRRLILHAPATGRAPSAHDANWIRGDSQQDWRRRDRNLDVPRGTRPPQLACVAGRVLAERLLPVPRCPRRDRCRAANSTHRDLLRGVVRRAARDRLATAEHPGVPSAREQPTRCHLSDLGRRAGRVVRTQHGTALRRAARMAAGRCARAVDAADRDRGAVASPARSRRPWRRGSSRLGSSSFPSKSPRPYAQAATSSGSRRSPTWT